MSQVPLHVVADVLAKQSLGKRNSSTFSDQIAAYLLSEHRVNELDSLLRDMMQYRADHGQVEVIAVSAHPLTATVVGDITKQITALFPDATNIMVTQTIDPSVIGGVRLELAHQQLDLSVRAKLNSFKQLTAAGRN